MWNNTLVWPDLSPNGNSNHLCYWGSISFSTKQKGFGFCIGRLTDGRMSTFHRRWLQIYGWELGLVCLKFGCQKILKLGPNDDETERVC